MSKGPSRYYPNRVIVEISDEMLADLEGERKLAPGVVPSRAEVIRALLADAMADRAKRRKEAEGIEFVPGGAAFRPPPELHRENQK